jgi:hypothetical protein
MAVTQNTYTGDGATVLFSFTFPYLETTDIKVSLNGVITTAYTLANATTVQFNTAPANGAAIRIFRQTDDADLAATFYPGSAIRSQDLNENFNQNLYVTQESNRDAAQAISTANGAVTTANSATSTANTALSNSTTAISTANGAVSTASSAVSTANSAVSTANSAVSTANSAVSTANSAVSTANNALSVANAADSVADLALVTAQDVVDDATNAVSIANQALAIVAGTVQFQGIANVAAIPASPDDLDGVQILDSTGIESFTPLSGLPGGFVGSSALFVRLQYDEGGSTWEYAGYGANDPDVRYLKREGGTMTGAILGDNSTSASTPGYGFDGDANTGLGRPGADELALITGGTARVTMDSAGAVAIPGSLAVTGALTKGGNNVVTTGDTGSVTSTMILDGTILNADINASAAIAGTKISPDFGSQTVTTTGVISSALGAAATPSITFTGDLNTGIYSPGADEVAISTDGSERIRIDSTGRLGLGTSSPGVPFDLKLTSSTTYSATTAADNAIAIYNDSNTTGAFGSLKILTRNANDTAGSVNLVGLSTSTNFASDFAIQQRTTAGVYRENLRITHDGKVGIGTTSPAQALDVNGNVQISGSTPRLLANMSGTQSSRFAIQNSTTNGNTRFFLYPNGTGNISAINGINNSDPNASDYQSFDLAVIGTTDVRLRSSKSGSGSFLPITFHTSDNERVRIDSSGRLLVGTSTDLSPGFDSKLQVATASFDSSVSLRRDQNVIGASSLLFVKSRGSLGGNTIVQSGDSLGNINFYGTDGATAQPAAGISAAVDGTPGAGDMPGRLVFSTTADGASSPTERMRITNAGFITNKGSSIYVDDLPGAGFTLAPTRATFTTNSGNVVRINRDGNDGDLITFHQDSAQEGSISVSGSTVSYNGAHLSRWSQLPGGAEREEILRGTVLSNIDEMCAWGEEDNEQLNRMKVSDVDGDPNVSGVFQAWDDDDDTYTDDFYCAMTGDFIIRIAEGVTVQRGDLLMSAGDGTAKPQDDDIIRSKTIAKVTSTHVTCTYDDGSYCVPCVLMAC